MQSNLLTSRQKLIFLSKLYQDVIFYNNYRSFGKIGYVAGVDSIYVNLQWVMGTEEGNPRTLLGGGASKTPLAKQCNH